MNPPKNQTENLDLESSTNAPPSTAEATAPSIRSIPYARIFALGAFQKTLQEKRYPHVSPEKRDVYKKLMDCLDAVEEPHPKSTISLVSLELLVLSGLITALACTLTLDDMKQHQFLRLEMWQWVTMVLMVASGLSVVRFATFLVLWPVKRWWRIHKYVVFFTRQLKPCLDVTLWFCIVLLGWFILFRPRLRDVHGDLSLVVTCQVTRFLIALCLGSFLWLLKNLLYLKLEADLHYGQLFDRLQQTVVYLHGLQIIHMRGMWKFLTDNRIRKKPAVRMPSFKGGNEEAAADANATTKEKMKGENIWMEVLAMEKESAPIWILRRLAEEYMIQVKLRPLPGTSLDRTREDKEILNHAKKLFKLLINKKSDTKDLRPGDIDLNSIRCPHFHAELSPSDRVFTHMLHMPLRGTDADSRLHLDLAPVELDLIDKS